MANKVRQDVVDKTYEALKLEASPRTAKSLQVLKQVCDTQVKAKKLNFTIAEIGRLSEAVGGPKAQTIRNKTAPAKTYRALLNAFENAYQAKEVKELASEGAEDLIASIEDTRLRIKMMDVLAENKLLKKQIQQQQMALNAPVISDMQGNAITSDTKAIPLNDLELKALSHFISPDNQKHYGFSVSPTGQILDTDGNAITKHGFVDAIEKLTTVSDQKLIEG